MSNPLIQHLDQVLISEGQIRQRIKELGEELSRSYEGRDVTVLAVLHGSVLFAADLMQATPLPMYLDCLRVSSYHGATASSGQVDLEAADLAHLKGRDVLIVDDILDTGRTLDAVRNHLLSLGVKSAKSCVLLDKQTTRAVEFDADFVGFPIEDQFVVGYGLDYQGRYRNLPLIGILKPEFIEP